jgi:hypothetical protein
VGELSLPQGDICSADHHFPQDRGEIGSKNTSNNQLKRELDESALLTSSKNSNLSTSLASHFDPMGWSGAPPESAADNGGLPE